MKDEILQNHTKSNTNLQIEQHIRYPALGLVRKMVNPRMKSTYIRKTYSALPSQDGTDLIPDSGAYIYIYIYIHTFLYIYIYMYIYIYTSEASGQKEILKTTAYAKLSWPNCKIIYYERRTFVQNHTKSNRI